MIHPEHRTPNTEHRTPKVQCSVLNVGCSFPPWLPYAPRVASVLPTNRANPASTSCWRFVWSLQRILVAVFVATFVDRALADKVRDRLRPRHTSHEPGSLSPSVESGFLMERSFHQKTTLEASPSGVEGASRGFRAPIRAQGGERAFHEPFQSRTPNTEHRTSKGSLAFGVGCSMFDVRSRQVHGPNARCRNRGGFPWTVVHRLLPSRG
jgi:hypothetical protein